MWHQLRAGLGAFAVAAVLLQGCSTSPDQRSCATSADCVAKSGEVQYLCYKELDNKCHPKKFLDEGLSCGLDDHCMSGTNCVGNAGQRRCFRLRSEGENCSSPQECSNGMLCYGKDKACHPRNALGLREACASDDECQASLLCFAGDRTCHQRGFLNIGQNCNRTIECRSGACDDGTCQDPSCTDSNECTGGLLCYEIDRRCHPPHYLENGRPCISDLACRSGTCNVGVCSGRR